MGPYITLHPELCMVVEEDGALVGYACAVLDCKKFKQKQEVAWIPEMCEKYPKDQASNKELSKFAQVHLFCFICTSEV